MCILTIALHSVSSVSRIYRLMGSWYETLGRKNVMPLARVWTLGRQNVSVKCRVEINSIGREQCSSVYLVGRLSMTSDTSNTATKLGRSVSCDILKGHTHIGLRHFFTKCIQLMFFYFLQSPYLRALYKCGYNYLLVYCLLHRNFNVPTALHTYHSSTLCNTS